MTVPQLVPDAAERLERLKSEDPDAYREAVETLAELEQLYEENRLQFFEPHPKQRTFLQSRDRIKAFLGGNRSGKTTCGIVDDLVQAVDEGCLPEHLKAVKKWDPPFHCRIVTPDFTSTMEGVVFEKLREWAPKGQLLGGSWDKAYDKQLRILRFANGSWFQFMTFEQDLDKFGGAALHRTHYDEEPPEQIRKECQARLIDHAGDELFTMTPLLGMSWMYDSVYERRDSPGITVVQVATDENPHLDQQSMDDFFASLTPEEKLARKEGKFVAFGGVVLQGWQDHLHLIDPIDPEHLDGQTIIVGIDPGVVRGAVVWCAFDRDDRMLVFDELYPRNQDVGSVAQQIKEKNHRWGIEPAYYVIDPSGRNRTMTGTVADDFSTHGIYSSLGQNDREAGILQLRRRLWADPPGLIVSRECQNWLWEKTRWRVEEDEDAQKAKRAKGTDSFATIGPDHLMDCTRYVAMEHFWGPHSRETEPKEEPWRPDWAPPFEWFADRSNSGAPPMGQYS